MESIPVMQEKMFMTETIHNIPEHIAIIMDGNGRWAKKHALGRISGHKRGGSRPHGDPNVP